MIDKRKFDFSTCLNNDRVFPRSLASGGGTKIDKSQMDEDAYKELISP